MNFWTAAVANLKVIQVIVAIFASTAALKTIVWPSISNKIFATPAVLIHAIAVPPATIGVRTPFVVTLSKVRPCLPKSAVIQIVDADGALVVVETDWHLPLPVADGITAKFFWTPPFGIAEGSVESATFEVWHHECQDGPSPREAANYTLQNMLIEPRLRTGGH
jgi:hypothetical protein